MNKQLTREEIEDEMSLLKDERAKNGWTKKEANRHFKLIRKLDKLKQSGL